MSLTSPEASVSPFPRVGDAGPGVGPDHLGPAGPAWTIEAAGQTVRGWPWFVIRKRGGRRVRVNVHAGSARTDDIVLAIEAAVASLPEHPNRNTI